MTFQNGNSPHTHTHTRKEKKKKRRTRKKQQQDKLGKIAWAWDIIVNTLLILHVLVKADPFLGGRFNTLRDSHIFSDGEIWRDVVWVEVEGDDLVEDGGTGAKANEDETAH